MVNLMKKLYKLFMDVRYKLGLINELGDSIWRLKRLHKTCIKLNCCNRGNVYNQCHQPELCFICDEYRKATKTTEEDYGWGWDSE